jgi:hypothetical protein
MRGVSPDGRLANVTLLAGKPACSEIRGRDRLWTPSGHFGGHAEKAHGYSHWPVRRAAVACTWRPCDQTVIRDARDTKRLHIALGERLVSPRGTAFAR